MVDRVRTVRLASTAFCHLIGDTEKTGDPIAACFERFEQPTKMNDGRRFRINPREIES